MNFADTLKRLRKSKNITQKQLADYLNVTRSTIAGYETRHHHPDFKNLEKISQYFHVSINFLLSGSEELIDCEIWNAYSKLSQESKHDVLKYMKSLQAKNENTHK